VKSNKSEKIILGIESSCDETAIAVMKTPHSILSNVISSSLEKHKPFGGVVPEIACRHHLENIHIVLMEALKKAKVSLDSIDLIAVTNAPGLIGALLVGVSFAKTLSLALKKPLIGVSHLEAHLEAARIDYSDFKAPYLGLIVSGGHTNLVKVIREGRYQVIGGTIDDAVGEAFDKVAKLLDFGYPGGPIIDELAKEGNPDHVSFTCAPMVGTFDFSYSGIKTGVLNYLKKNAISQKDKADIVASFQKSAIEILVSKTVKAALKFKLNKISVGGGVSANSYLRKRLTEETKKNNLKVYFPRLEYTLDNGAMVAMAGYLKWKLKKHADLNLTAKPSVGW